MAMTTLRRWRGGGVAALLLGVLLLAVLATANSLPADAEAKATLPADLAKIPSDGLLIVSGRVADLLGSELLQSVRAKTAKIGDELVKEFHERFGLPLEQIERMTLFLLSPLHAEGEPLLFVRTVKPYDLAKVIATIKNAKAKQYKDEMLYVSKDLAIYPLDDRSLVYGKLRDVQGLIDHPQPKTEGNLAAALRLAADKHSLVLGVNIKLFNDKVGDRLPGEVEPFQPLLQALAANLRVDFAADSRAAAVLTFAAEKDAQAAIKPAEAGLTLLCASLDRFLGEARPGESQEWKDFLHVLKQFQESLKAMRIEQKDATLQASMKVKIDAMAAGRTLLEAVRKVREAAGRAQGQNNLRQIALAMHNYTVPMGGRLPAHAIYSKDGKPLLSWRVSILPYIEQQKLYHQFHLNEPWDSEHNKKLLGKMPTIYAHPQDEKTLQEHTTYYQVFVGKGAVFEGKEGLRFPQSITDGTSNTIMIVEASKAVPWTKPEDIPYDPDKPLPKLGLPGVPYFLAALCDGSVRTVSQGISKETLRSVITCNNGDIPGSDW
jgi:hypothetical protein